MASRVGKSLAAVVASRYIQAMDLDKWPVKKQLQMLKDEHRRVSDGGNAGWNNNTQAQNAAWYMKGVAGWEVKALAAPDFGFLVTAPNGKTFRAGITGEDLPLADWLRDETNYLEKLSDKAAEINRGMKKEKLLKNEGKAPVAGAGTCPACFGSYKLRTRRGAEHPRVVLHGYQRPGYGIVEGRCFGVAYPPFELSPEGSKAWLEQLVIELKGLGEKQTSLKKTLREPTSERQEIQFIDLKKDRSLHHERFTPEHPDWDKAVKRYRSKAEDDLAGTVRLIAQLKAEIAELKKRIATWKPRELV
jgi:hypothetical protein